MKGRRLISKGHPLTTLHTLYEHTFMCIACATSRHAVSRRLAAHGIEACRIVSRRASNALPLCGTLSHLGELRVTTQPNLQCSYSITSTVRVSRDHACGHAHSHSHAHRIHGACLMCPSIRCRASHIVRLSIARIASNMFNPSWVVHHAQQITLSITSLARN